MSLLQQLKDVTRPQVHTVILGGKSFNVRSMGPQSRAIYVSLVIQAAAENSNVPAHVIVALGLCDADGARPAKDEQDAIVGELATLDGAELGVAARKVLDLSGLTKEALARAEKNSQPAGALVSAPAGVGDGQDSGATAAGT